MQVIVAAHSLASFAFLHSDEFSCINVAVEWGFFNKLLMETATGKTVNGRTVIVRRFKEGQDPRTCHILFVSSSEEKRVPQILERLKGYPILTVSETIGFAQSGGMINFLVEGNKVRLEINLDSTARARLKISAKVIAVARLVT